MALDEGYIKFDLRWQQTALLLKETTSEIVRYRNSCFQRKYIGITEGVGYGNISIRYQNSNQFIISGTQTGGLKRLSARHFTMVTKIDFANNSVACNGPVKASAESLTHAIFYALDKNIQSVIHIHHHAMWEKLKYKVPTTSEATPYGTIEMCKEVERLYSSSDLKEKKLLVMAGHQDGIISFGQNLEEALSVLDDHALRHAE
ncbi:MAG: class II aldolase/adducin family protein [Chitinophagales bacterium]|nr:class II aldolase/adducin family protein [Chitinophagales bacterium]